MAGLVARIQRLPAVVNLLALQGLEPALHLERRAPPLDRAGDRRRLDPVNAPFAGRSGLRSSLHVLRHVLRHALPRIAPHEYCYFIQYEAICNRLTRRPCLRVRIGRLTFHASRLHAPPLTDRTALARSTQPADPLAGFVGLARHGNHRSRPGCPPDAEQHNGRMGRGGGCSSPAASASSVRTLRGAWSRSAPTC